MSSNWQTWVALGVVAVTVILFIVRAIRKSRSPSTGCGSGGDCGAANSGSNAEVIRKLKKSAKGR